MLPLDDPRWKTYEGGYHGSFCDASVPLRELFANGSSEELWQSIFDELHHQGDVGPASYAAVPHLVEFARTQPKLDWNMLGMIALIELERPNNNNPAVPEELSEAYFQSIASLPALLALHPDTEWDELTMSAAAACLALARGQRAFARVYFELDLDSGKRWLREDGGGDPDEDEDADSDED